MKVYFDNAATTKVRDEVVDEISDVLKNCFGNPSSTHSYGRSAKSYIETSRKSIAKILNCEPGEIIFNSGGTESDNSILKCAVKDLGVKHVISSKIEHHAITHTLEEIESKDVKVHYVSLKDEGEVDIEDLESILKSNNEPKLVSLMYINNEIGNILDVKLVSELCKKHNAYFHSDAVQAVGHYPIDLSSLNIDFLSLNTQGSEFAILKGLNQSLNSGKIKSILLENDLDNRYIGATDDFIEQQIFLKECGFKLFEIVLIRELMKKKAGVKRIYPFYVHRSVDIERG